jgi:hypothetical protein
LLADRIARGVGWFRCAFKLARLLDTPMWRAADGAVLQVMQHHELQKASGNEEQVSFCPRCGQLPDGDRRMEEAREFFHASWKGDVPKRSELDFALAWAYFRRKI